MLNLTPLTNDNPAQTMRDTMLELGKHEAIALPDGMDLTKPFLITVPDKRKVEDLTHKYLSAAQHLKPTQRKGTARLKDLESLIAWANRFKGDSSVLFANPVMENPSLTCIADYHDEGPADPTNPLGDPSARHGHHRGIYDFPLSEDWKAWMAVSDTPLEKDDMGEFIETQAKNIMDPTPAIIAGAQDDKNDDWENRLIETACKIEGRYGQLTQLLQMSKQFLVNETSDLKLTTNRDTGEAEMKFINEHKGLNGQPLNLPNLIIIAIPVFLNGPLYRMPVRFRYRKTGGQVKFILSIYNPEKAFEASFDESLDLAVAHTDLPLFKGTPEA
jgi:hypothetical protein